MAWETPTGTIDGINPPTLTFAGVLSAETITVDRLVQIPGVDYTTSGAQAIFTWVLPLGSIVRGQYTALTSTTAAAATTFDYSATGILTRIRDLAYAGTSIRDWDDPKLLRLVNAEVEEYLVPFIMGARKNHFDTFKDTPLVANQQLYWLPGDASAMKVRAVLLVDSSGNPYSPMQERELEDVIGMGASYFTGNLPTGVPEVYAFQGNQILIFPAPSGLPALSLRFHYIRRPSALVTNASAVQSTSFPGGAAAGYFRVGLSGSTPAGIAAAATVDLVQHGPGFDLLYTGLVNAVSAGVYVECAGTLPTNATVGDWLCVSGTAPVITGGIPEMVIGCLVKKCVLEIMAAKADDAAFKRTSALMQLDEKRAHQFLNRRNTGDRPKAGIGSLYKFKRGWGSPY